MKIKRYGLPAGKIPILPLFGAGVFVGLIFVNLGKSILLENTGLLDEYTLYDMKYMTVESSALFYYVLQQRMISILLLAVLSTTYLGLAVCGGVTIWYGMCAGVFLGTAVIRYGIKGILLVMAGVFPQYLLYVPGMLALLFWCQGIYKTIYLDRTCGFDGSKTFLMPKSILKLVAIIIVFILGCVLEAFMNPRILKGLLSVF